MQFLDGFGCVVPFLGWVGGRGLLICVVYKRTCDPRWIIYCDRHVIPYQTSYLAIGIVGFVFVLTSDITGDIPSLSSWV
jgi:hypothetical protein